MNLLRDPFLDVRLKDGSQCRIAAFGISDLNVNDIVAPRPDFRGALFQLLIGILQTTFAPPTLKDWIDHFKTPPSEEALRQALKPYVDAFELQSNGPAFMQDMDLLPDAKAIPIAALLIESPGSNTAQKNLDHFVHDGNVNAICPRCAVTALFTLQINAPAGGAGHRVSLRGGGPMTTLLVPRDPDATLWQKLWLNVLPQDAIGYPPIEKLSTVLPWLGSTRTSDAKGIGDTNPHDVHLLQAYWSMPRRVRVNFEHMQAGHCDLCGESGDQLVSQYRTRNYGTNYNGHWQHPLTPYSVDPKTVPLSIKGQKGGIGYWQWAGLVIGNDESKHVAAQVVSHVHSKQPKLAAKLWCFGFDMDNMKARCWYDSTLPLYGVEPERQHAFAKSVRSLIDVASESASLLTKYVKAARFGRPGDVPTDAAIPMSFWQRSESRFYMRLEQLSALDFDNDALLAAVYRGWLHDVRITALRLFDEWVQSAPLEEMNVRRVVEAQANLSKWLSANKVVKPLRKMIDAYLKETA